MNLIFDVDGTLTAPREEIDFYFRKELEFYATDHNIYLATGSDYSKTIEQLGQDFVENFVIYSFNCSGNSIWHRGSEVYRNEWDLPEECYSWLKQEITKSPFKVKTGNHIEKRPGMVNFTVLGRNATWEERAEYVSYDTSVNERKTIASAFNELFSKEYDLSAQVAGSTGFDIYPTGRDKSQILQYFKKVPVKFFGDDTAPGGNDYSLALAIEERSLPGDKVFKVNSPIETRYLLTLL
jgi:phosphomannomutase